MRVAAVALGVVWIALVGAFGYAAATVQPTTAGVAAGAGALLIAGAGILYAWREPGR